MHTSARCADLDREIASTTSAIRALVEERREGVTKMEDMSGEGLLGAVAEGKKMWISRAEEKKLELYASLAHMYRHSVVFCAHVRAVLQV